ncbi:hypothetical protein PV08_05138 [Exophiala spinifera]|uniref:Major facilitator superfamily (MFS) profile domain-containing protein n=1 Tax=Exophiala spinifera TaxID=91928 RepID=A0A0D2BG35_9EURO|nr:uncharacterized protein PV08_05138 [Exophiala spinifera]KIW17943.1 hypothetical protein PV08_05138 [Exophiala spinifera]
MAVDRDSIVSRSMDENTCLLHDEAGSGLNTPPDHNDTNKRPAELDRPLPKLQIFLLSASRLVEPVACFVIFPFINQMIYETGVPIEDVGFYSGLIESLFSLTQMILMIPWGKAADCYGRKPVLVVSLMGLGVFTALFGLSQNLWQMILLRSLSGMFGGMLITVRTMISENSTPKTQARAFAFFSFAGNLGILLGPAIGGVLSNPATEYPRLFGNFTLFKEYPYLLPTLVGGCVAAITSITCAVFIQETLPKDDGILGAPSSYNTKQPRISTWSLLRYPGILVVLCVYNYAYFLGNACSATLPVYFFTPVKMGGFGFSPYQISVYFCIAGFAQALWQLIVFPYLQHRFGTIRVIQASAGCWPVYFISFPIGNILLRHHLERVFWPVGSIFVVLLSGIAMSYTAVQLALNDISPSPTTLSTINALALMVTSGLRAVSPGTFSSLVAVGIKGHILNGQLIWAVLLPLGIIFAVMTKFLPKGCEKPVEG